MDYAELIANIEGGLQSLIARRDALREQLDATERSIHEQIGALKLARRFAEVKAESDKGDEVAE